MKVFISWSGERSKAVAELLDEWLQCVLQAVTPWMSSKDIDRGSLWFSEITDQLANTKIGIICLTKHNQSKPWILFEAGALAKGLSSQRVCTFLIDIEPTEIDNPLAQFNHTTPDRDGVFLLLRTINSLLGEHKLTDKVFEKVFETYWPEFESLFSSIIKSTPETGKITPRSDENLLSEVLSSVRNMEKRLRNIEAHSPSYPKFEQIELDISKEMNKMPPSIAERIIKDMVIEGKSEEQILEFLHQEGIPRHWALKRIKRFTSNQNDNLFSME